MAVCAGGHRRIRGHLQDGATGRADIHTLAVTPDQLGATGPDRDVLSRTAGQRIIADAAVYPV